MPEREDFLAALRARYEAYLDEVAELERKRKPGEGIFGMGGGPKNDPCHSRFAEELRGELASFAASEPEATAAEEALRYVLGQPESENVPQSAYWMLQAVHGLGLELIDRLEPGDAAALAASYEKNYPRRKRFPVQDQVLRELKRRAKG